jgi:PAS domain S-box-containing protein
MQAKAKTEPELMKEIGKLQKRLKEAEKELITYRKNETVSLPAQKLARSVLDQSTVIIIICDENGRIIQASQMAHRFFIGKLVGRAFDSVCPLTLTSPLPFGPKQFSISSVLAGKILRSQEVTYDHDGQVSYFLLNARPLSDGGNILGCLVSLTDLTQHKKMEEQIAHLASFPQLNPNPVVEVDLAGHVHYSNPAAERLFPDLKEAGLNHPWLMDLEKISEILKTEGRRTHVRELRVGDHWYQQTVHSVTEETRLRIYGFDITRRKRAEEETQKLLTAIQEEKERLSALVNSVNDEVWFADTEKRFTLANPSALQEFGFSSIDALEVEKFAESLEVYRPDGSPRPLKEAPPLRALRGEVLSNLEEIIRTPASGELRYRQVSAAPVTDSSGNIIGSVSVVRDITERKQMEEELRRSREELEVRVQERTAELMSVVEELQDEMSERKRAEEALREQSRILEGFFTSTITPLVFLDRDFNFIRVNEAYAKACQRDMPEFPGRNHFEFYPHEENEMIFRRVVETKTPYQAIAKPFSFSDHPEWDVTYWDWTLTPLLDDRGEVESLVFSLEDVTERKRAQEQLKAAHQYTRSLIEASLDPFVTINPEGKVTDVNRATELVTGILREQLIGSDFSNYFTEPEKAREGYQQVFEMGSVRDYPLAIRHTSGHITPVLYNATVYRNEAGKVQGVFAAARDITAQKVAEEKAMSEFVLRESIENSIVTGILVLDRIGRLTHVNPAFCKMTGWSKEELVESMPPFVFWPPEDLEIRSRSHQELIGGQVPNGGFEARLRRKNEGRFDALIMVSPLKDAQEKVLGWVASVGDIAERKETERRTSATNALLTLFSQKTSRKEYLEAVTDLIHSWSGCRCVGIRILDEKGFVPYESYVGFSQTFWEKENRISVHRDQCACIRVVAGDPDPQDLPMMTPNGSFHCDNTFKFVGQLSEEEKTRFRGVCIENGFLSVSIVPIRYRNKVLGAIHLADEREGQLPLKGMTFIESVAPLIGEAINRFNLEEEIRESENRLRTLSSQLLTIQETERKRVAHELHDGIGQTLTAVKFKVEGTLQQMAKARSKSKEALESIIPVIQQSVEEVRRIQMDLRPSTLDDLGILATLEWFCREYQKIYSHLHIEKEISIKEDEVSTPIKTVIYRVVQEALNNIAKHSKADLIHLSLGKGEDKIQLVIQDNGQGFDLEEILSPDRSRRGLGLTSMRERTELSRGTFEIETNKGKGTTIRASWPI